MVQTPRSTKFKDPFKKDAVNLEELNKSLPDQPFIAVFGTSHTYGSCRRGDQKDLCKYPKVSALTLAPSMCSETVLVNV